MADFPQSHVTHTTTTTTTFSSGHIQLDISYIKTLPGILRIVEMVLCIIVFICAVSACSVYESFGACGWSGFVSFMGFLIVLTFLLIYLFHIHDAAIAIPWHLIELIVYAIWTFFLFTCGIAMAVRAADYGTIAHVWMFSKVRDSLGAGSFFAFVAAIVFGIQTFFLFREWNNRRGTTTRPNISGPA